jgi:hypothetical protein
MYTFPTMYVFRASWLLSGRPRHTCGVSAGDWESFQTLQYTQDQGGAGFHRYAQSVLLSLVIDGKRLSDSYPAPKFGGAITVANTMVIIMDRLGDLYGYDLTTGFFEPLRIPPLPNNLEAYLQRRGGFFVAKSNLLLSQCTRRIPCAWHHVLIGRKCPTLDSIRRRLRILLILWSERRPPLPLLQHRDDVLTMPHK